MLKAYKYRIYPNREQKEQIEKTFSHTRYVYNNILSYRKTMYENFNISLSKIDCNNYCNKILKPLLEWLKEVDKFSLTNAIYDTDNAYQKFFKEHAGYPKFKSKKDNKKSYTTNYTNNNIEVDCNGNKIKLPKLKEVRAKVHRKIKGIIKSATVSKVPSGKYFVSILVDEEIEKLDKNNKSIGIDLGIKDICITSDGKKYENIKTLRKYEKKLAKLQRRLSNKVRRSNNYYKAKKKVSLCYEKISNVRKDYLHKISHELINENQVIISENLQVSNMIQNKNLSKSISDASWYELTRQIEYKAIWYGRKYLKVGRFYASSQICHVCGYKNSDIKDLSIRKWTCPSCGKEHDRDYNAAINILQEGLRTLKVA